MNNMRKSKYFEKIKPLLKKPFFTSKEARKRGVPSRMLIYFYKKGFLERLGKGIYKDTKYLSNIDVDLEDLVLVAKSIRDGVICLISALYFYELTDQIMREYWIAIPNKNRVPKRDFTRIFRMRNMTLGLKKIKIGNIEVKIFDRERTIVDAFRYLDKETALKALANYFKDKKHKPNIKKIIDYSNKLNININSYIVAMTYE